MHNFVHIKGGGSFCILIFRKYKLVHKRFILNNVGQSLHVTISFPKPYPKRGTSDHLFYMSLGLQSIKIRGTRFTSRRSFCRGEVLLNIPFHKRQVRLNQSSTDSLCPFVVTVPYVLRSPVIPDKVKSMLNSVSLPLVQNTEIAYSREVLLLTAFSMYSKSMWRSTWSTLLVVPSVSRKNAFTPIQSKGLPLFDAKLSQKEYFGPVGRILGETEARQALETILLEKVDQDRYLYLACRNNDIMNMLWSECFAMHQPVWFTSPSFLRGCASASLPLKWNSSLLFHAHAYARQFVFHLPQPNLGSSPPTTFTLPSSLQPSHVALCPFLSTTPRLPRNPLTPFHSPFQPLLPPGGEKTQNVQLVYVQLKGNTHKKDKQTNIHKYDKQRDIAPKTDTPIDIPNRDTRIHHSPHRDIHNKIKPPPHTRRYLRLLATRAIPPGTPLRVEYRSAYRGAMLPCTTRESPPPSVGNPAVQRSSGTDSSVSTSPAPSGMGNPSLRERSGTDSSVSASSAPFVMGNPPLQRSSGTDSSVSSSSSLSSYSSFPCFTPGEWLWTFGSPLPTGLVTEEEQGRRRESASQASRDLFRWNRRTTPGCFVSGVPEGVAYLRETRERLRELWEGRGKDREERQGVGEKEGEVGWGKSV